jgi:tetratricopeptide (TPR) repeat protein
MLEGFNFGTPAIADQLTGKLALLKHYNAVSITPEYFHAAMESIRLRSLNVPLDAVLHPASFFAQEVAAEQKAEAQAAPAVPEKDLTAQQWFERAFTATNLDEQLRCYTEAIRLKPDFHAALLNRGNTRVFKGDLQGALLDYNESLRLEPRRGPQKRGNVRAELGDVAGALQDYDEEIRINPSWGAFYMRGKARRTIGDIDGALHDFGEAIGLKPDFSEALIDRGLVFVERDEAKAALQDFGEVIRPNPGNATAYYNRGNVRRDEGDLDGALQDYDESIRLRHDHAPVFVNRGYVRTEKGDVALALQDFDEAIRLKPEFADAFMHRAYARKANGDLEGALRDCDEAIRLSPGSSGAFMNRGNVRSVIGDLQGAMQDYNEAIRPRPDSAIAFYSRGLERSENGDLPGAMQDYDEAIRLKPNYPDALYGRGLERLAAGDRDGARRDFDEVIRIKPNNVHAIYNRGSIRLAEGEVDSALEDFDEAIRHKPDYSIALYSRGIRRIMKGDIDGALEDLDRVIGLDPSHFEALYNRGVARLSKGEIDRALRDFHQTIRLKPDFVLALQGRAVVRSKRGELDRALVDYDRAIYLKPDSGETFFNRAMLQLDRVIGRVGEILLRSEIALRRLDRRMAEQQLNLLQLTTCRPAELRSRATEIVRRDIRQARARHIRLQHLPNNFLGHSVPGDLIAPVDRPEQMPLRHAGDHRPCIDRILRPGRHRNSTDAPVLADQIDDAPTVVALLNVLHGQVRQFGPAKSAPEQRREHGPVAQSLLCSHVWGVQERLCLAERQPVANTDAVRPDALDPGDARRQFRGEKPVVGRFDRQFANRRDPDVDRDRAEPTRLERHPPSGHGRLCESRRSRCFGKPRDELIQPEIVNPARDRRRDAVEHQRLQ